MYQLDIKIDIPDVKALVSAGQKVALVQEVASGAFSGGVKAEGETGELVEGSEIAHGDGDDTPDIVNFQAGKVVWVTFAPVQNTTVTWERDVAIYQSGQPSSGAEIVQSNSVRPVSPGVVYPYTTSGFGAGQRPAGTDLNSYYMCNSNAHSGLAFGLARDCTVNGNKLPGSPVANSIRTVLNGEIGCFQLVDRIHLFVGTLTGVGVFQNVALIHLSTTAISEDTPVTATYSDGGFTFT
ncbi:hypothetical protein [Roseibium album]|uniref:hypothetical protein n=1 Tax=Roseibium album TaxID=311410 RepID=UPI0018C93917|nr:hypothetical protein [Labrenzia sp. EL_162]MBG6193509.1 hypothetical protein [Labrenzia sp. EL_159]